MFCTMTMVLDTIEELVEYHGWQYERLDGNTKTEDRKEIVNNFMTRPEVNCTFRYNT